MYPYGQPNPYQQQNTSSSNQAAFPGMGYYAQPNQPMQQQVYQQPQQQFNYGGQANFLGQVQSYANQPRPPIPVKPQADNVEDKHRRYKLEQQRKFKNFGKSFNNTSIDSMLSNIVSSQTNPKTKQTMEHYNKSQREQDDFGDFLQATPSQPISATPAISLAASSQPVSTLSGQQEISSSNHSIAPYCSKEMPTQHPAVPVHAHKPEIDLQSKMMSSLDLNKSQHAYMKFNPVAVLPPKRPETKTYQPSTKAANWSSLTAVEAFIVEKPVDPPAAPTSTPAAATQESTAMVPWTDDVSNAPLVYKHIYEACAASDGLMDTSKLYPILLQCNLPNETLGELWTLANQKIPGRLNQKELFILLALIALTQGGQKNLAVASALSLPSAPIPYVSAYHNPQAPIPVQTVELKQPPTANHLEISQEDDDFDDFQDFQSVSSLPAENTAIATGSATFVSPINTSSTLPSKTKVNHPISTNTVHTSTATLNESFTSTSSVSHSSSMLQTDEKPKLFTNSKIPIISSLATSKTTVKTGSNATALDIEPSGNKNDKYAALSGMNQEPDLFQGYENSGNSTTKFDLPSNQSPAFPDLEPPSYSSMFQNDRPSSSDLNHFSDFVSSISQDQGHSDQKSQSSLITDLAWDAPAKSDSSTKVPEENMNFPFHGNTGDSFAIKPNRFKDLLATSVNDSSSIKSDTNSVKSLELHSLSQTISQQSLGTLNHSAGIESPISPELKTAPKKRYGPSFCDDDYDDFVEAPPDLPPPDTYDDFEVFHEGNSTLMDFDAFATFDPSEKSPEQATTISKSDAQALQSISRLSEEADDEFLPLSPVAFPVNPTAPISVVPEEETVEENDLKAPNDINMEDIIVDKGTKVEVTVNHVAPIITDNHNKYENIELSSDDWHIAPTRTDQSDIYVEKWQKCLSACNQLISETNEILSSIQSPDLCNEVVYSIKGQRFISDLSEVYGVARRICCSMRKLKIERDNIQQVHKQIELAWYNLLAFCPNTTVADPSTIPTNHDVGTCGVCLIGLDSNSISYAGREYHATCANFWINCVDSVLPALQPSGESVWR